MSRQIDRATARFEYTKFSRMWRDQLRIQGKYGMKGSPKRPTFAEWYQTEKQQKPTQSEYVPMYAPDTYDQDPWAETQKPDEDADRGVTTINIMGDDSE